MKISRYTFSVAVKELFTPHPESIYNENLLL